VSIAIRILESIIYIPDFTGIGQFQYQNRRVIRNIAFPHHNLGENISLGGIENTRVFHGLEDQLQSKFIQISIDAGNCFFVIPGFFQHTCIVYRFSFRNTPRLVVESGKEKLMEKNKDDMPLSAPILSEREKRRVKRPSKALLEEKEDKKHKASVKNMLK